MKEWCKAWLKTPYDFKIITKNPFLSHSLWVRDLIDQSTRSWNTNLIDYIFVERDKEEIHKVPLFPVATENFLIWRYTKDGEFSVKTACHMGLEFLERGANTRCSADTSMQTNDLESMP